MKYMQQVNRITPGGKIIIYKQIEAWHMYNVLHLQSIAHHVHITPLITIPIWRISKYQKNTLYNNCTIPEHEGRKHGFYRLKVYLSFNLYMDLLHIIILVSTLRICIVHGLFMMKQHV